MSRTVISVEHLGKEYVIGGRESDGGTFRDMIVSAAASPFRRLKRLRGKVAAEERIWALKNVSFEVKEGEVVGIIGRNGAGKSTLLKVLSRITAPTEGRVTIRGRVASILEVGTGFHGELTGRENIYLNGAILGMNRTEINHKFDEIVDFSGVERFLDTPVKRYSSGMTVRLGFAVAAHLEPEILIVDEALAVGDVDFQRRCLGRMRDVAGAGRTVLFVSHNMAAIAGLCHVGLMLETGAIVQAGPVHSVIESYLQHGTASTSYAGLAEHPRRKSMKPLLTHLKLDKAAVNSGDSFVMKIGYSFKEPIRRPEFVAHFVNSQGLTVFGAISDFQSNDIPEIVVGDGEVTYEVASLPLMPGTYAITLKLWTPHIKLDEVERAGSFQVSWLGHEKWPPRLGVVYVDAVWKFQSTADNTVAGELAI